MKASRNIHYWLAPELKKYLPKRNIDYVGVLQVIADVMQVNVSDMIDKGRVREVVDARHTAMWILKNSYNLKLIYIARILGRKDHTTVVHAINKVNDLMGTDKFFRLKMERILESI